VRSMDLIPPSLEDVFIASVREEKHRSSHVIEEEQS
jgi:hypothetical protein